MIWKKNKILDEIKKACSKRIPNPFQITDGTGYLDIFAKKAISGDIQCHAPHRTETVEDVLQFPGGNEKVGDSVKNKQVAL
jgi:hypothetical protein